MVFFLAARGGGLVEGVELVGGGREKIARRCLLCTYKTNF